MKMALRSARLWKAVQFQEFRIIILKKATA
jgi:hypothetical protein